MADETYLDLWDGDGLGTLWYRHLPAKSLEEYVSGEFETIRITVEGRSFWLNDPTVAGEGEYKDLAEAKKAGDGIVAEGEAKLPALLLADAGLDAGDWAFHDHDPVRFECLSDPELVILVDDAGVSQPFDAYQGEDHLGRFGEIADAVAAVTSRRAPKP